MEQNLLVNYWRKLKNHKERKYYHFVQIIIKKPQYKGEGSSKYKCKCNNNNNNKIVRPQDNLPQINQVVVQQ